MSAKKSILRALAAGPLTEKQLKRETGLDAKRLSKEIKMLQKEKKIESGKTGLSLRTGKTVWGGFAQQDIAATIVKLGRSFGFAAPHDGGEDIFIPGKLLRGAMPGDEVLVSLFENPRVLGSREGEVTSILAEQEIIVGTVEKRDGALYLIPDNALDTPLKFLKSKEDGAQNGEKAAVRILSRGQRHDEHRVGIVLRFGSAQSAKENARAILYGAGINAQFSPEVQKDAKKLAAQPVENQLAGRVDMRAETIFTIDSASTKDMDDAISIERVKGGYKLGVHIADVSHYVQPKTPLDEEALQRGTSVYYADSVVPMLPKALSNDICSLNPEEDRLAFSCIMQLDEEANLLQYKFMKTVICSRLKGVYEEINEIFAEQADSAVEKKYAGVVESLFIMRELYHKLAAKHKLRGGLEIESEEAKLVVDKAGRCVDVQKRARGECERLIEEFMLLANTAAAKTAQQADIPFVYRVHEKPTADRAENLKSILAAVGINVKFEKWVPSQTELAKLLDETRGTNLERFVHTAVLRSMAKAKYEPQPKGHYGLSLDDYCHFTSPIRRYPDLAIHRILGELVSGTPKRELAKKYAEFAEKASAISSQRELVAQRAERDCDDCYKAEYMKQFEGQVFEGVISSVIQFGIYVELPNTIEGLVHISRLSKNSLELVDGVSLHDAITGKTYRIGDVLRVRLLNADIPSGNIDFELE